MAKVKKVKPIVGEICLYGAYSCGHGYIARADDGMDGRLFGDGEPVKSRGLNDAFWLGMMDLKDAGFIGRVQVFAPGGTRMAEVSNEGVLPYFGQLDWRPAPVYVISAEAIEAAARAQGNEPVTFVKDELGEWRIES